MEALPGSFFVLSILLAGSYLLSRLMEGEPVFPKPDDVEDVEGLLKLGLGFTSALMLLVAIGIFGYDFTLYVRIAVTFVMLILIYYVMRYRALPSLLMIGLLTTLVIFNPIDPVTMSRGEWILIDLAVAIGLPALAYLYIKRHKKREQRISSVYKKS